MQVFDPGQLRAARRKCMMKQAEVAKVLHVSSASVANIENGRVRASAEDVAVLADLYGMKVGDFFVESLEKN